MKNARLFKASFACQLACIACLIAFQPAFAQTTVQIGNGTSVNTGTVASIYAPICRLNASSSNDFSRGNILYSAAELATAGITNGTGITKLAFFKVGTGASNAGFSFKIYMRNSGTVAPLSTSTTWANILSTHTLVYSRDAQQIPDATGWIEFTLDVPFQYTGQSLEMAFESDMSAIVGSPANGPYDWQYTTGFADYIVGNISTSAVTTLSGSVANYKNRPNIQLTYNGTCAGSPVAGDAVKNVAGAVCPGTSVELGLSNNVPAIGLGYVWQSSASMGGPFVDISGSSSSSFYSVAPAVTTYYRAAVSCGGSTSYSNPVEVTIVQNLSGVFTIDPVLPASGTNFQSFADALKVLKCGISGPVTFNVSGTAVFNEYVVIDSIPGASAANRITFNGNGATLTYANSSTSEAAVIKLNGANYVTIDSFTIVPTGATIGYGVQLINDADSNIIRHCTINNNTSVSNTSLAGIVIVPAATSGSTTGGTNSCDANQFIGNSINGGYVGISIAANGSTSTVYNNKIIGNTITNFHTYGIYINGNDGTIIDSNDVSRQTRNSTAVFNGIYFTSNSQNCVVSRNKVHNTFDANPGAGTTSNGIYFTSCDATLGNENRVVNNQVYNFSGTGIHYALYNGGSDYVKYYHNSVNFDNTTPSGASSPTHAFYQTTSATGIEVKNNIFKITREGTSDRWALYFGTVGSGIESNNNVVSMGNAAGSYVGYFNAGNQLTLTDWITASSQDANSKSEDPLYTDAANGNLLPANPAINDIGTPVGVSVDILGNPRSLTAPDPGAYEFSGTTCTAPPTPGNITIAGVMPVCQGAEISLNLENNSIGEGQTYKWMSSDTENGTYVDISTASASTGLVINPTATKWYKAAVTCNGNTQLTAAVQIVVQPAFPGGIYTINSTVPTGGSNFQTFGDAVSAISCGITSAVTFNVVFGTGPYIEQVVIPDVPGTSAINTITFNGNGNTLSYLATENDKRAVLKLDGTDYVTINDLVIQAYGLNTNEYGFGIQLTNSADHNTIKGCTIETAVTPATASSSSFAGIVLSGSPISATSASACDYNIIDSNTVTGGYYGIIVYGGSSQLVTGNQVTRNTVKDFYYSGIYLAYADSALVEKNDISRPTRTSIANFYGIYLNSGGTAALISKNKIHNAFDGATGSTSGFFGVYLSGFDGTLSSPNVVVNNLIYNIKSDGPVTAFYHSSSDYVKYYHNTVSFDDQSSAVSNTYSSSALVLLNDDPGVEFVNNIISITRSGNSLVRAINISTSAPVNFMSNYNVWNVHTMSSYNLIGLISSTQYPTLMDWKTAVGGSYDQNSKDANPSFLDIFSDNYTPTEQAINGIGKNIGITTDINDSSRIVVAPDPGAIEFSNEVCTAPPTGGAAIVDVNTPVCPGTTIHLNLSGNSYGVNQTYQWEFSNDFAGPYTPVSAVGFTPDLETLSPNASGYFRAVVVCSGQTDYSIPVLVEAPLLFSGNYTINSTVPTGGSNFQTFADAYNAMKCGIGGPVVLDVVLGTGPYNEQLILPYINGMSAANTITIHGNGETITFAGTTTNERAVVKLDGAKYVTIDSLAILPTATPSTTTYNYGVHILNDADNNTIKNCLINVTTATTSTNNCGIIINSSPTGTYSTVGNSMCDSNLIMNNTIMGGYAGIAVMADSKTYRIYGNKIIGNTVTDFYSYGINLGGNVDAVIEGNEISRPTRSSVTTFYGINMSDSCNNTLISKNKIHDPFAGNTASTSAAYGIRLLGDADPGQDNVVVNNIIYNFIGGTGTQNGILNNGADNSKMYHNTMSLDDVSASCACGTRGIYFQVSSTTGVDIRNNIITISRGGTGDRQAMFFAPTSVASFTIDNNAFFLQSGATVNAVANVGGTGGTGAGGTNYNTLADWQTTGKDVNGVYADPMYTDPATGDLKPANPVIDNKGVFVGITTDIRNSPRSNTTPDVGAIEFNTTSIQYVFTGTGNWNVPANWLNSTIPPANLPAGSEIIINHAVDGECVLNVSQTLMPGSKLTVLPFKNFRVIGNLEVNN